MVIGSVDFQWEHRRPFLWKQCDLFSNLAVELGLPIRDVERVARDTHAIIMCMGEYGVFRRVAKWGKWFLSCRAVCCWI